MKLINVSRPLKEIEIGPDNIPYSVWLKRRVNSNEVVSPDVVLEFMNVFDSKRDGAIVFRGDLAMWLWDSRGDFISVAE